MNQAFSQQLIASLSLFIQEEIKKLLTEVGFNSSDFVQAKAINIGWLKSPDKLKRLYDELRSRRFLQNDCTFESFKGIFIGQPVPILWCASRSDLLYIFLHLIEEEMIYPSKALHKLIASVFLDKDGKALNPISLKTILKRVRDGGRKRDLDLIIAFCK